MCGRCACLDSTQRTAGLNVDNSIGSQGWLVLSQAIAALTNLLVLQLVGMVWLWLSIHLNALEICAFTYVYISMCVCVNDDDDRV